VGGTHGPGPLEVDYCILQNNAEGVHLDNLYQDSHIRNCQVIYNGGGCYLSWYNNALFSFEDNLVTNNGSGAQIGFLIEDSPCYHIQNNTFMVNQDYDVIAEGSRYMI